MKNIKIKGYKSIKDLDLDLKPINVFIGANGSGKSNFLSFFDFLKQIYRRNLQEFVALKGIDTFLHRGDKYTSEINTFLDFNGRNGYSFTLKKGDNGLIFTDEELWYKPDKINYDTPKNIAYYSNESNLSDHTMERASYIRSYLTHITFFATNYCEKCLSSILYLDLNPRHLEQYSFHMPTRPLSL